MEFFKRKLECAIGFDDFTVGKVCSLLLKSTKWNLKCLVGVAYLPVPALWKATLTIPMDMKLSQLK